MDLYSDARAFPETLRGRAIVVRSADLENHGITEAAAWWRAAHGSGIVRAHQDVYLLGSPAPDLLDRIHAALAVCPPHAVVGFHTAAALQGFGVVDDVNVHVVVPAGSLFPHRNGIKVHQTALLVGPPVLACDVACTPPARTAVDLARVLRRAQALPILDASLAADACDRDALLAEVARHRGLAGVRRVRELVGLADKRSECRQETHLRLLMHDAGLTGFIPQYAVEDEYGWPRYRLDLADPKRKVAAEYDGSSHLGRPSLRRDRDRHNWLDERGWRMRYFTDANLYRGPQGIIRSLQAALKGR